LVKSMLIRTYGEQQSKEMLLTLRDYLKTHHYMHNRYMNQLKSLQQHRKALKTKSQ